MPFLLIFLTKTPSRTLLELIFIIYAFIVCAYPYLLGFALNYIEIRLVVNGCLVQAITFQEIQFITSKVSMITIYLLLDINSIAIELLG